MTKHRRRGLHCCASTIALMPAVRSQFEKVPAMSLIQPLYGIDELVFTVVSVECKLLMARARTCDAWTA